MPNKLNLKTQRGIPGVLGGHKSKNLGRLSNGWTDLHQIWYTSADSSGNGNRPNTICPSTFGEGGEGSQIQMSGEDVKRLDRLAPNLVHMCIFIWVAPRHLGRGGEGSQIQMSGEDVKRLDRLAPNLVHMCIFIWEWIYATKLPQETQGGIWGF